MTLQELLTETVETPSLEYWADESTAGALGALAVGLHSTGISLRETVAALETSASTGIVLTSLTEAQRTSLRTDMLAVNNEPRAAHSSD